MEEDSFTRIIEQSRFRKMNLYLESLKITVESLLSGVMLPRRVNAKLMGISG